MRSTSARVGFKSAKVRGSDGMPNFRRARRGAQAGGNTAADHFDAHSPDKDAAKRTKRLDGLLAGFEETTVPKLMLIHCLKVKISRPIVWQHTMR
jgi:hypothetical protein